MIRIHKPAEVPEVLARRGKEEREKLPKEYDRDPAAYNSRDKKFAFKTQLYGHGSVKEALIAAQHGKCCFCESKIGPDGDVEHYRPKACYSQDRDDALHGPGYYWLAYEWSNLLLSCSTCNQRYKRNLFPLSDPARRATSHHGDTADEDPLLIHPREQDPEESVSFRREIPYSINGNPHGTATIKVLGLNRESLNESRRDWLSVLARLHEIVEAADRLPDHLQPRVERARQILAHAVTDAAEFAAMARAAARAGYYVES